MLDTQDTQETQDIQDTQDRQDAFDTLRDPRNRPMVVAGVGLLLALLFIGCFVSYQVLTYMLKPAPKPDLSLAPTATLTNQPTQPPAKEQAVIADTPTLPAPQVIPPTPIPTAIVEFKANLAQSVRATGESCYYSSSSLNNIFQPVASGAWSAIEHYYCDNGYWDIGTRDSVVGKTGDWGQDGVAEKILIKYDRSGNILDRIFIGPDGNEFSGPKH